MAIGEIVTFVAYRFISNFVLDIDDNGFEAWPLPSPTANKFTLNSEHYGIADSYDTIQALFDRQASRAGKRSHEAYASWWSSKFYSYMFCVDADGRGYFTPVIDSTYIVAFCNDHGKIDTANSLHDVPPGAFILATGCAATITAVIDAQTQIIDGNHVIPATDVADFETWLERLEDWHSKHFPHDEWRLHVFTERWLGKFEQGL